MPLLPQLVYPLLNWVCFRANRRLTEVKKIGNDYVLAELRFQQTHHSQRLADSLLRV
jgi:hypothetical protein